MKKFSPDRYAALFLREEAEEKDGRLDVLLDRILMRFMTSPSVPVYLIKSQVKDGKIELVFSELPDEVIPQIAQLTGVEDYEVYRFRDNNSQTCTGYSFTPNSDDIENIQV